MLGFFSLISSKLTVLNSAILPDKDNFGNLQFVLVLVLLVVLVKKLKLPSAASAQKNGKISRLFDMQDARAEESHAHG